MYFKNTLKSCDHTAQIHFPCVVEHPGNVTIEAETSIAAFLHIWGNGGVTIGKRVMIGSHTAITSATHQSGAERMHGSLVTAPVVIEDDVWIGAHTVIFPGVTVGHNSIVAAGSVVRHDVSPYSVVAGVPARLVRANRLQAQTEMS